MALSFSRMGSNSIKWDTGDADMLPMWVADMDLPIDSTITRAIEDRLRHPYLGYEFLPESYFEAFIDWVSRYQGWDIERKWLSYSPSVMATVRLAVEVFSKPGDNIIIPSPVYYPFFASARDKGREVSECALIYDEAAGQYMLDFDAIEASARNPQTSMLLFCNPHNPVGRVWTQDEIRRLVDICSRHDVFIVSDEIHADIIHTGNRFSPLVPELIAAGRADLGFAVQAPSKTFNIPGLLSCHMIVPDAQIRSRLVKAIDGAGLELPNVLAAAASQAAYSSSRPWFDDTLRLLDDNRSTLQRFTAEHLTGEAVNLVPQATYLYWLDLRETEKRKGLNSRQAFKSLKHDGRLWLSPGYMFSAQAAGFYRLNFACPKAMLQDGLERLRSWLAQT